MSDTDLEKLAEDTKKYPYPQASAIDVDFFDINKRSNKGKALFNTDNEFTYSDKEEIKYVLKEPVYIDSFKVTFQKDSKVKDTKIVFLKPNGATTQYEFPDNREFVDLSVKTLVIEISFIPPKSFYFRKQKLHFHKIEVFGRTESELANLEKISKEIKTLHEQLKAEADTVINTNKDILIKIQEEREGILATHENLDEEITTFKNELEDLVKNKELKSQEVKKVEENLVKLKGQTALVQNNHDSLVTKEQTLGDSIEKKNLTITELNSKIVKEEQKLKELQRDTNLIAYDVKGFIKSAKSHIKIYIGLSALPWVIICAISIILFNNANNIAGLSLIEKEKVDLATVFWTRIPFAIIVSSILYFSYEVSINFANKVLDLHQRILDLQKIGIIAQDVSEASLYNLEDFTDEEKYELRTKLKMDLLRSHLAKDFDKPNPFNITNPSIMARFYKWKEALKNGSSEKVKTLEEKQEDNEEK